MIFFKPDVDKLASENNIPGLIRALKKNDPEVSEKAFYALENMKDQHEEVIEMVREVLSDLNPGVRALAAMMLARSHDDSAYQSLKKIIVYGSVKEKIEMLRVLASHGDAHNLNIANIFVLGLKDSKELVRIESIRAMGNSKDLFYIQYLLEALNDKMFKIRLEAAKALGKIGGEAVVEGLIGALLDRNSDVRIAAKESLSSIGGEKAAMALSDAPFQLLMEKMNANDASREDTVKHIGKLKIKDGIPLVRKTLFDKYKNIRIESIRALANLRDKGSIESISGLLEDYYWDVRLEALKALEVMPSPTIMNAVAKATEDQNKNVRDEALKLYYGLKVRFGDPEENGS